MADISGDWNRNMPSGSSQIRQGDDLMRQHWRSLQSTIQDEHYFSGSAQSAGVHKPGAARIFSAQTSSSVSTTPYSGRLLYTTADNSLYVLGPSATSALAGPAKGLFHVRQTAVSANINPDSVTTLSSLTDVFDTGPFLSGVSRILIPSTHSGYWRFSLDCQIAGTYAMNTGETLYAELKCVDTDSAIFSKYERGSPTSNVGSRIAGEWIEKISRASTYALEFNNVSNTTVTGITVELFGERIG